MKSYWFPTCHADEQVENEEDISKVNDILPSASGSSLVDEKKSSQKNDKNVAERSEASNPSIVVRQRLGPSVRKLLIESGIDVSTLRGTGPGGAVVKGDVLAAMKTGQTSAKLTTTKEREEVNQAAAAAPKHLAGATPHTSTISYEDIPTTQIRKVCEFRSTLSNFG